MMNGYAINILLLFMLQPDVQALYLMDAVTIYMHVTDAIIRAGGDYRDGSKIAAKCKNAPFKGELLRFL